MVEVLFSESAAGSLAVAMGHGNEIGGAVSVIIRTEDGSTPDPAELERLQRQAEAREAENWANALPMPGSRADLLHFPLALSVGPIDQPGVGVQRAQVMQQFFSIFPGMEDEAKLLVQQSKERLMQLQDRAAAGEPVRIWTSANPDEACGICWLMAQLQAMDFARLQLSVVQLPAWQRLPDGTFLHGSGWGEVAPHLWGHLARGAVALDPEQCSQMARHWQILQKQNAPLRAMVNGQLVSAPQTLYDGWILELLARQPEKFHQAQFIGQVLRQCDLGLPDAWVALRMEQWIADGTLEAISEPDADGPRYHRMLRKCRQM